MIGPVRNFVRLRHCTDTSAAFSVRMRFMAHMVRRARRVRVQIARRSGVLKTKVRSALRLANWLCTPSVMHLHCSSCALRRIQALRNSRRPTDSFLQLRLRHGSRGCCSGAFSFAFGILRVGANLPARLRNAHAAGRFQAPRGSAGCHPASRPALSRRTTGSSAKR